MTRSLFWIVLATLLPFTFGSAQERPQGGKPYSQRTVNLAIRAIERTDPSRWELVFLNDQSTYVTSLDRETVVALPHGQFTVWLTRDFETPIGGANGDVWWTKDRETIDCENHRSISLRDIYYSKSGTVLLDRSDRAEWQDDVPATVGEAENREVCRYLQSLSK